MSYHEAGPGSELLRKFSAIPTGTRSRWLVLLVWIVAIVVFSPLAAKLVDVQDNDTESWLPANAESLQVAKLQEQFQTDNLMPAFFVYHREEGLTQEDLAKVESDRQALEQQWPQWVPGPAIPSEDGKVVFFSVPVTIDGDDFEPLLDYVEAARDLTGDGENGLDVHLTGPAGYGYDSFEVFEGIDGQLLAASATVVAILLLLTYRSPFIWIVPLLSVGFALQISNGVVYLLAKYADLVVNGQSAGILPVLVFGAGTDYALLLIARYREELRRHESPREAMAFALRQAAPAIAASSATVAIGLLCLLVADLNSNSSLGPVGALGILSALVAMLTLLPVILVIFGRKLFWPFVPHFGSESREKEGIWDRIGNWVAARPRPIWVGTVALLILLAFGSLGIDTVLPQSDQFTTDPDSVTGQEMLAQSFPAGSSQPAVVIANAASADAVEQAALGMTEIVAGVQKTGEVNGLVSFDVTLVAEPATDAAFDSVQQLRDQLQSIDGADAKVGGADAIAYDVSEANARDRTVIMPLILVVVFIILVLLLRSVIAPLVLIATVVVSFFASLGASVLVFEHIFGFSAVEGSVPLLGFVFLVALGVDYNIFLMGRVHEESKTLGTRQGMLKGLSVTGGVITSAGLVLAATFSVLGVLPLVVMAEIGFIVAFGVLLDTFIVRSVMVPAITLDLDKRVWWPSRLSK